MKFEIDFVELMFLSEATWPDGPIARSMAFDDLSKVHYHKMTTEEREQFLAHIKQQRYFTLENEKCRHLYARFNPKNQFTVTTLRNQNGFEEVAEHNTYRYEERYHIDIQRSLLEGYITHVVRDYDGQVIFDIKKAKK